MDLQRRSICSLGVSVDFYWVGCTDGEHIQAAVEALWSAIMQTPGRLRNPYVERMVRAEFKDRLEVAARGCLEPITQVKSMDEYPMIAMFEIRWSGVTVRGRVPETMKERSVEVEMRLYYVELGEFGLAVLGCHVHEKALDGVSHWIRDEQDFEIEQAVQRYAEGLPHSWDVPELVEQREVKNNKT